MLLSSNGLRPWSSEPMMRVRFLPGVLFGVACTKALARNPCKVSVVGSIPIRSTISWAVSIKGVQQVKAFSAACKRRFESFTVHLEVRWTYTILNQSGMNLAELKS